MCPAFRSGISLRCDRRSNTLENWLVCHIYSASDMATKIPGLVEKNTHMIFADQAATESKFPRVCAFFRHGDAALVPVAAAGVQAQASYSPCVWKHIWALTTLRGVSVRARPEHSSVAPFQQCRRKTTVACKAAVFAEGQDRVPTPWPRSRNQPWLEGVHIGGPPGPVQ